MLKLIRTTIMGGIIFMIPVAILVAVIGQGLKIARAIAKPVAAVLPVNMVGGVVVARVLAIVSLLLICLLAGLLARFVLARKAVDALEANVLSRIPAYALLKTKTQSLRVTTGSSRSSLWARARTTIATPISPRCFRVSAGGSTIPRSML
jgi:uncharacterized membrane protein